MIENEKQRQAALSWIGYRRASIAAGGQSWLAGEQAMEEIMRHHTSVQVYETRMETAMTDRASGEKSRSEGGADDGTLQALRLIESVGALAPFQIVPIRAHEGTIMSAGELMAARVRWAQKAGYRVLTINVPIEFAPYNAIIRISETGTEDRNRDYLAEIDDKTRLAG